MRSGELLPGAGVCLAGRERARRGVPRLRAHVGGYHRLRRRRERCSLPAGHRISARDTLVVMDDADAFSELYKREGESVLIFLTRRTWDGEMALELTAETFAVALRSWRKLGSLGLEQQRAWLFTVARRLLARYLRRARVERRALQRLGMQTPQLEHDDLLLIERRAGLPELRGKLELELARLSSSQREALRLRVLEERSYEEISLQLGVSEQTARARVSRALRALAQALEPYHAAQDARVANCDGAREGA
jgi:RNA polymerase sigma factor (sigma-70 family)